MAYAAWLLAIGVLLGYEWYALKRHKMTLSRAVWTLNNAWPMTSTLIGFILGGLLVHFFWHWCPGCTCP